MIESSPTLASALSHDWLAYVVLAGLILHGFMSFTTWWVGHFVEWTHQMRLHWRKFKSEPEPTVTRL